MGRRLRVPEDRFAGSKSARRVGPNSGARGCTPQSCRFRDLHGEIAKHAQVFGLSTQSTAYQHEAVDRLHLPFPLLSDSALAFGEALRLPTFEIDGERLLKRVTLILEARRIVKVFYPVFAPTQNADSVLDWFQTQLGKTSFPLA